MNFHPTVLASLLAFACATVSLASPVEIVSPEISGARQPQIAVAPGGRIHVAFGKDDTIYHVASEDGGQTFSAPAKVATLPKLALGMRRGPRISATDSTIAVTAISNSDGNLQGWISTDGGKTWRDSGKINGADKSAREGLHAMDGNGRGAVFVTWLDLRDGGTELWSAVSPDGGATWGDHTRVYQSPDGHICECCHPSAAMDGKGRIAVMWRNWLGGSRDMYAAVSDDHGKTFAPAQKLGSGTWKLNGCPMDGGAITFDAEGQLRAVWRREKTVFASGTAPTEERLADSAFQPIAVAGKRGIYYLWEADGGLMVQAADVKPRLLAEKANFAAVGSLPNGGAIVVWESNANSRKALLAEVIE